MQNKTIQIGVLVLVLFGLGVSASLLFQDSDPLVLTGQKTAISFENTEIDVGTLEQGVPKNISIVFTNSGEFPLVIYQVETSCGCTEAQWPKKTVKPGKEDEISVTYDAKTPGSFMKTLTVFGNFAEGSKRLVIKGEVKEPAISFLFKEQGHSEY